MSTKSKTPRVDRLENEQREGFMKSVGDNLHRNCSNIDSLPQIVVIAHTANFALGEQMQLFDLPKSSWIANHKGEDDLSDAREWIRRNPSCWQKFSTKLHSICRTTTRAPLRALCWASLECADTEGRAVEWDNDIKAALVRLHLNKHPEDAPFIETRRANVDSLGGVA